MPRLALISAGLLALGLATAPVAQAAGGQSAPAPGTTVEMPILVAPMTNDGKLTAYAYISSSLIATSTSAAINVRAKTPFIQDAFVRDVNGSSIVMPNQPDKLDSQHLQARLLADARRIVGPDIIAAIQFTQVQISQLRGGAGQ